MKIIQQTQKTTTNEEIDLTVINTRVTKDGDHRMMIGGNERVVIEIIET